MVQGLDHQMKSVIPSTRKHMRSGLRARGEGLHATGTFGAIGHWGENSVRKLASGKMLAANYGALGVTSSMILSRVERLVSQL